MLRAIVASIIFPTRTPQKPTRCPSRTAVSDGVASTRRCVPTASYCWRLLMHLAETPKIQRWSHYTRQPCTTHSDYPMSSEDQEKHPRVAALRSTQEILLARNRGEQELCDAREALEQKNQELQQQREWFQVTLSSIGDAVITTDALGAVTFLNPIAEAMTGWTSAEAAGLPLSKIFTIVDEFTGEPVEHPVKTVLREGRIVRLANTSLVRRDGTVRAIEDTRGSHSGSHGQADRHCHGFSRRDGPTQGRRGVNRKRCPVPYHFQPSCGWYCCDGLDGSIYKGQSKICRRIWLLYRRTAAANIAAAHAPLGSSLRATEHCPPRGR